MGWPDDTELELVPPDPLVENFALAEIADKAVAANPDVIVAEQNVVKACAASAISRWHISQWLPQWVVIRLKMLSQLCRVPSATAVGSLRGTPLISANASIRRPPGRAAPRPRELADYRVLLKVNAGTARRAYLRAVSRTHSN